jgi:hypothetical protein
MDLLEMNDWKTRHALIFIKLKDRIGQRDDMLSNIPSWNRITARYPVIKYNAGEQQESGCLHFCDAL